MKQAAHLRIAAALLLGLIPNACGPSQEISYDAAPVLAAVLDTLASRFEGSGRRPVLDPRISELPATQYFESVGASTQLTRAFTAANRSRQALDSSETASLDIEVIPSPLLAQADASDAVDPLSDVLGFEVYGVFLTVPGFSADGTEAILDYGFVCGNLCAERHVARLRFQDERWVIVQDFLYLIS